jgi:hypothetical protein
MIAKEIDMALAAPNPSDGSIAGAISSLQGDLSMAGWVPDMDIPYAKFFTLSSVQSLAVAYVTLQGGDAIPDTQAYLEFYDKPTGIWEKKASAPTISDFKRSSFAVAQIDSGVPGEAWFLAWGLMIGSSDGSRNVRLYAFDGSKVRTSGSVIGFRAQPSRQRQTQSRLNIKTVSPLVGGHTKFCM